MFLTNLYISIYTHIQAFLKNKEGASAIEYVLLAAMVAVAIVAFVPTISAQVKIIFNQVLVALGGTAVS
ncbi:Flp family type IVb pilin [Pseudomonas sp. NPDC089734]|uniref:Flp family type IVb pilin n=1 Tax=Pseudomonas sp. NPDC089734 TaxID=3364469 RepID=UPI00380785EF